MKDLVAGFYAKWFPITAAVYAVCGTKLYRMWSERGHISNDMWNTFTSAGLKEVWLMGIAEQGFAEDPKFRDIEKYL